MMIDYAKVGYVRRVAALVHATVMFPRVIFKFANRMLKEDGFSFWERVKLNIKGQIQFRWAFTPSQTQILGSHDHQRHGGINASHLDIIDLFNAITGGKQLPSDRPPGIQKIQQNRQKQKPTLSMFDFELLTHNLQEGKEILESSGFDDRFSSHLTDFIQHVDQAIKEVELLVK